MTDAESRAVDEAWRQTFDTSERPHDEPPDDEGAAETVDEPAPAAEAARAPEPSIEPPHAASACDFCHRGIGIAEAFHRVTIGMNDDGPAAAAGSTVEETSEMLVCAECRPAVDASVDRFLEELWKLRLGTAEQKPPEPPALPTERFSGRLVSTPYGIVSPELVAVGIEMLETAARANPQSPEGFALGIVVGRLQSFGLTNAEVHGLVDRVLLQTVVSQPTVQA